MPNNAPHNALRAAVDRAIANGSPIIAEMPTQASLLARPDNEADMTINLAISGNRLVSILNALDAALYQTGRYRLEGNEVVADAPWFAELRATTESVRDELSRQRCAKREIAARLDSAMAAEIVAARPDMLPTYPEA